MTTTSPEEEIIPVDFDSVLDKIGNFGKFQKVLYYSVCIPIIFTTCLGLSVVFSAAIPKQRCFVPSCDNPELPEYQDAFTHGFINFSIPFDHDGKGEYSKCKEYTFLNITNNTCSKDNFDQNEQKSCSKILYDHEYYGSTLISEFGLSCGGEWKIPLVESMSFVGIMIAAMSCGLLADKYGRRHVLMSCLAISVVSGFMEAVSVDFWMYLIFNTTAALGQAGAFQTGFILALESVGQSHRVFCGIVIEFFFVAGEVVLTIIAMGLRSWRWLTGLPVIFLSGILCLWPFCPESVRWLQSKGRHVKAESLMTRMATVNKITDFNIDDHRLQQGSPQVQVKESLLNVIKCTPLAFRFANCCFCWMTVTMVYYGLSLNATNLAGSPYTNFILVALVELPGYSLSYFTMERLGRRKSTALSLLIGGGSCLLSSILSLFQQVNFITTLATITFLLGKLGVTWTFGNVYIYTSELFPTSARTACVGACSTSGRIGAIISPYIAVLGATHAWLPSFVFGIFGLISGFLVHWFLPETLGRALPETVSEAAELNGPAVVHVEDDADTEEVNEATPLIT